MPFAPLFLLAGLALLALFLSLTPRGFVSPILGILLKGSAAMARANPAPESVAERRAKTAKDLAFAGPARSNRLLVEELSIPGPGGPLPLRSYRLRDEAPSSILLFLHGGGWVVGDIGSYDPIAGGLSQEAGALGFSLGYRLAPEFPFPAATEDVLAAYRWILAAMDAGRLPRLPLFVAGDSAGGNLAAVLCLQARELGLPLPAGQLLFYPVTDISRSDSPSYERFARGFILEKAEMDWFIARYAPRQADREDLRASPLLAPDLSGLPPAFVVTAGLDVLRDEGEAYARRLREAGVGVEARRMKGLVHGFVSMGRFLPAAGRTLRRAARFMRKTAAG